MDRPTHISRIGKTSRVRPNGGLVRDLFTQHEMRLTVDNVLAALDLFMTADIRSIYDGRGVLKPISEWPAETAFTISSIESRELLGDDGQLVGYIKKVHFADKVQILTLAMRHLGLLSDKLTVNTDGPNLRELTDEQLNARRAEIEAQIRKVDERRRDLAKVGKGKLFESIRDDFGERPPE
jgi:hypothetical protein